MGKEGKNFFLDGKIKALINQFFQIQAENNKEINVYNVYIEDLIDYLIGFRDYSRIGRNKLKLAVVRVLDQLKTQSNFEKKLKKENEENNHITKNDNQEINKIKDYNLLNIHIIDSYKEKQDKNNYNDSKIESVLPFSNFNNKKKRKINENNIIKNSSDITRDFSFEPSTLPTIGYEYLGGMEHILEEIRESIEWPMIYPQIYQELNAKPSKGILLHGPPGCGKTLLANAIACEIGRKLKNLSYFRISAPELVSGMSGESESNIRKLFLSAKEKAPSLIFIDEIDVICPKRDSVQKEMERRIVAQLLTSFDEINEEELFSNRIIVIGSTNRIDSIDPSLRRNGRFDKEIALGVPDEKTRAEILKTQSKKLKLEGNFDFFSIARKTPGFVGADLLALTKEAASIAIKRIISSFEENLQNKNSNDIQEKNDDEVSKNIPEEILKNLYIVMNDFEEAIKKVQPSAKREGFATIPNVTWEDVGALHEIREELSRFIILPIKKPELYKSVGLDTPTGVLLYGPPGCGKTLLAKAIANDCNASFISIKGPELLNKYVGESERAVRKIFERAKLSAPCIIFFDELDALCPKREDDGNQVTQRVVNQLLTELDGLEERKGIFIIAATNRPDIIDPAMLRPQRLDKLLYVPLPNEKERFQILQTLTRKSNLDKNIDLLKIASNCKRFSGADLAALVREASLIALYKFVDLNNISSYEKENISNIIITNTDFENALKKVNPSVTEQQEKQYLSLQFTIKQSNLKIF